MIGLLASVVLLAGCWQKPVVWSPDGQQAAVISEKGLFLCNAEGRLSPRLAENVLRATWLPDSQGLILVRFEEVTRWDAGKVRLHPLTHQRVRSWAEAALGGLRKGEAWTNVFEGLAASQRLQEDELNAVKLYLRDTQSDDLNKVPGLPEQELGSLSLKLYSLQRATARFPELTLGLVIADGLFAPPLELRIAPDGQAVAFVPMQDKDRMELFVAPLNSTATAPQRVEAANVAYLPDWSTDGRWLYYIRNPHPAQDDQMLALGILTRREVRDAQLNLRIAEKPEDLAGVLFDPGANVRCLKDGRILFSALELTLPLTEKEAPQQQQLFVLDPARQATLVRVLPAQALHQLPDGLSLFELSPDEKRLAVPDDQGGIYVVTLASGEVQVLQEPTKDGRYSTLPSWRSADELCFIRRRKPDAPKTEQPEVVLWKLPDGSRVLSQHWPPDAREGILTQ